MDETTPTRTPRRRDDRRRLVAECERCGLSVSKKDSTHRLRQRLDRAQRSSPTQRSPSESASPPSSDATTDDQPAKASEATTKNNGFFGTAPKQKRRLLLLAAAAIVVVVALLLPARFEERSFPALGTQAALKALPHSDAREEVAGFLASWESKRRKHSASLLVVGADETVLALERSVNAAVLRSENPRDVKDFLRATRRNFENALILSNLSRSPAYAEHLIDPYFRLDVHPDVGVPIDRSAFLFHLPRRDDDEAYCDGSSPTAARTALVHAFPGGGLPQAFVNRIQYATLACPTTTSNASSSATTVADD